MPRVRSRPIADSSGVSQTLEMEALNVPARRLHWAAFASSALFAVIGVVLMWIARDQSKDWPLAWYFGAHGLLPSALMFLVGLFLYRRFSRRLAAREALLRSLEQATE